MKYILCPTGLTRLKDIEIFPNCFYLYSVNGNLEYAVFNQKREITRTKIDIKELGDDTFAKDIKAAVEKGFLSQ